MVVLSGEIANPKPLSKRDKTKRPAELKLRRVNIFFVELRGICKGSKVIDLIKAHYK